LSQLNAPVPIAARFNLIGPTVDVSFSTPLVANLSAAGSWFVRKNNQRWSVGSAAAGQSKVQLVLSGQVMNMGPNVVTYSPPPFDVLSLGGLVPAPAFVNYPLA